MALRVNFLFFVLLFSSSGLAENCLCPQVQCDPCQRVVLLGVEELACSAGAKSTCDKYVCENVDNFFQCLAGEKPVYASPQDVISRLTEPRDPAEEKPETIDFRKFAEKENIDVQEEPVTVPSTKPSVVKMEPVRSLASYLPPPEKVDFEVTVRFGKVEINQKKISKPVRVKSSFVVKAREKSEIVIRGLKSHFTVKMSAGSQWSANTSEDVLWLKPLQGEMVVSIKNTDLVHAVDTGLWRLAKRQGVFGVSVQKNVFTLLNDEGAAYLRRNELISSVQTIEPQKIIQLSTEEGILAMKDAKAPEVFKEKFKMPNHLRTSQRGIASGEPISQELCSTPAGTFESCAWKCFGSGAKDKKCGQAKNSQCIRFTCSADGLWKLPTSATPSECVVDTVRVGVCQ